jgi:hypothetical protein
MTKSDKFDNAKSTLLKYYSDSQTRLSTRLFAFSVVVFTLLQISSWSNKGLSAIARNIVLFSVNFSPTFIAFFFALLVIITYMVRTVFRFASFSAMCNWVIIEPFNSGGTDMIHSISESIFRKMSKKPERIFWVFPFNLFVCGRIVDDNKANDRLNKANNLTGWLVSFVLAFITLVYFLWIYYETLFG